MPISQDATTGPYPSYTNSIPSGGKFSPLPRIRPRAGCRFSARSAAFRFLGVFISGIIYAPTVCFVARGGRAAVVRRAMSSVSPNYSISVGGAIIPLYMTTG